MMTPNISNRAESVRQTLPFPKAAPAREEMAEKGVRQTLPFAKETAGDHDPAPREARAAEGAEGEESFAGHRARPKARRAQAETATREGEWTEAEPLASALSKRFASLRQIKETGIATVFRGQEIASGRQVVIEVLAEAAASNPEQVEMFYLEAEAAARLRHPRIVAASAAAAFAHTHLRVSADAPGAETLRELLARRGWLEPARAVRVMAQTAEALDYAHRIGVLHLNLQPENILLDSGGEAMMSGFGIAADGPEWARRGRATHGAPSYLSPEQTGGAAGDRASDLYALGVLLYEALTDRVPFDSNDLDYLRQRHKIQSPQPPHNFRPDIPTELSNLTMALLARNPEARALLFGDAEHFGATLKQACAADAARAREPARATNPMPLGEIAGELMASFGASDQALVATDPLAANARRQSRTWWRHWPWLALLALTLFWFVWLALSLPRGEAQRGDQPAPDAARSTPGSLPDEINRAAQPSPSSPAAVAGLIVRPGSAESLTDAQGVDQTAGATQQKREQSNHTPGPNNSPQSPADANYREPVKRAPPIYPAAARSRRRAGTVAVEVTIDDTGKVTQARSVSGRRLFRRAAERAARRWRFAPLARHDAPKQTNTLIVFNFQMTQKR